MRWITSTLCVAAVAIGAAAIAPRPAAAGWARCARQGQPCRHTQRLDQAVRFGLSARHGFVQRTLRRKQRAIRCDRAAFGRDPAAHKRKACWIWRYAWKRCAREGRPCRLPRGIRATLVRFGTTPHRRGKFRQKTATGRIRCDRAAFGGDPVPKHRKACWYWDTPH